MNIKFIAIPAIALAAGIGLTACGTTHTIIIKAAPTVTHTVTAPAPKPVKTTPAPAAPAPAFAPVLSVHNYRGIKPGYIALSGDGSYVVNDITWSSWGSTAYGTGTSDIQGCVPNCAEGSETPYSTTVELSGVSGGQFTQYSATRDGDTTSGATSEITGAGQVTGVVPPVPAPTAPAGSAVGNCGNGVTAGPNTSCAFAQNVASAYSGPGSDTEVVYSPATGQSYTMNYTESGDFVSATGGNDASVTFVYQPGEG